MDDKISKDLALLRDAQAKGKGATLGAYCKLSGPGWMQSAITLGGGSLGGALFLGVISGYSMLWVQLVAMVLGVIMLCAISYVTLSTQRSPFEMIRNEINPVLAWGWLIASLMANIIWVFPQYSLGYASITQNIAPEFFESRDGNTSKYLVSICFCFVVTAITLCYGKSGKGIKIYELVLKFMVMGIVLAFVGVVIKLATTANDFHFSEVLKGFIPSLDSFRLPVKEYQVALSQIGSESVRAYWTEEIVSAQRLRMVATASAAVGINMTFLLPYSLLNKGWTKEFRGLTIFDLSTGMVVPFVITVSCVVITSAYMFHGKPYEGLTSEVDGKVTIHQDSKGYGQYEELMKVRNEKGALASEAVTDSEKRVAAMLIKRDTKNFADSLSALTNNKTISHKLFGIGVLAMVMSSTSLLMLISGYVICEMLGKPHGGKTHRLGVLCGVVGVFWPLLWTGESKAFLVVVTSSAGYILLPIAFLTFFLMMNSKRILGSDLPRGKSRFTWNILMMTSLLVTGLASAWTATTNVWTVGKTESNPEGTTLEVGTYGLFLFLLCVAIGQWKMRKKHQLESQAGLNK